MATPGGLDEPYDAPLVVLVPGSVRAELDAAASEAGMTRSALVRQVIHLWLRKRREWLESEAVGQRGGS